MIRLNRIILIVIFISINSLLSAQVKALKDSVNNQISTQKIDTSKTGRLHLNALLGTMYLDELFLWLYGVSCEFPIAQDYTIPLDVRFLKTFGNELVKTIPIVSIGCKYYFSKKGKSDFYIQSTFGIFVISFLHLNFSLGTVYNVSKHVGIDINLTFYTLYTPNGDYNNYRIIPFNLNFGINLK